LKNKKGCLSRVDIGQIGDALDGTLQLDTLNFHIAPTSHTDNAADAADAQNAEGVRGAGVWLFQFNFSFGEQLDDLHTATSLSFFCYTQQV
jgi:hypothetical protein